jgi:lipoprotein-anchoring transpeptidase ErfK/SrfK
LQNSYTISTSSKGVGQQEGSGKTPLGLHSVAEKIGEGADPLAIFKSREPTGDFASIDAGIDSIVSRILWLSGLEALFNQGRNAEGNLVDTHDRYIYIHGTNRMENIGKPASAGCVRMNPNDVIDLFHKISEGTLVYIYQA